MLVQLAFNMPVLAGNPGPSVYTDIFSLVGANAVQVSVVVVSGGGTTNHTLKLFVEGSTEKETWHDQNGTTPAAVITIVADAGTGKTGAGSSAIMGFPYARCRLHMEGTGANNVTVAIVANTFAK